MFLNAGLGMRGGRVQRVLTSGGGGGADGFHFTPTAQDPDTVICYFCDLQLGDWERADDCKAVHRKLSPNCPLVLGVPCGNQPRWTQAGAGVGSNATPQQRLEDVLARKAALLQSITVSPEPAPSSLHAEPEPNPLNLPLEALHPNPGAPACADPPARLC
jgi:hypothetical protein